MSYHSLNRTLRKCWKSSLCRSKGNNLNLSSLYHTEPQWKCLRNSAAVLQINSWKHLEIFGKSRLIFLKRFIHTNNEQELSQNDLACIQTSDNLVQQIMIKDMIVISDFVTEEEEQRLFEEVEPYLKRMRYESSHWDDAIHSYRETERKQWREINKPIIQRIRDTAFPENVPQLSLVHILDLNKDGFIKPHVDAVRFCGNTIAGLSLLSSAVMRLVHTEDPSKHADILLKQRSLYIMKDEARYKYTHEVLKSEDSFFKDQPIPRDRRVAVICRNEP